MLLSLHCPFSVANLRVAHRLGRQPRVATANFGLRTTRASGAGGKAAQGTRLLSSLLLECWDGLRCLGSFPELQRGAAVWVIASGPRLRFPLTVLFRKTTSLLGAPVTAPWRPQRPRLQRPPLRCGRHLKRSGRQPPQLHGHRCMWTVRCSAHKRTGLVS